MDGIISGNGNGHLGSGPGFDWMDIPDILGRVIGGVTRGGQYPSFRVPEGGMQPGDLQGYDMTAGDPSTRLLFAQGMSGFRAQRFVAPDPTGKLHFFAPLGRPLLFSGDLAAAKRVGRVASKAARRVGRRRGGR